MRVRRISQTQRSPASALVSDNHTFVILVVVTLVYFLWMDLAMYYKLQTGRDALLTCQNYKNDTGSTEPGLPGQAYFDPFDPISVKLLMVDHLNHYVYGLANLKAIFDDETSFLCRYYPLCYWLDTKVLHISDKLLFITPDMISISHVVVASVGARLVVSDSLTQRRVGAFLFEVRSMLDSYDGMVARARRNERGMKQVHEFSVLFLWNFKRY